MYRGLRYLVARRKRNRYKCNYLCKIWPKPRLHRINDLYGQAGREVNSWEHAQKAIDLGTKKFLRRNFPNLDFSVAIRKGGAHIDGEQMKLSNECGITVGDNQRMIRIITDNQTLSEVFQKTGLWVYTQRCLRRAIGNNTTSSQNEKFSVFNIIIKPRLLGGSPTALISQTTVRKRKKRQRSIREFLTQNSEETNNQINNTNTDGTEVQVSEEAHMERESTLTGDGEQRNAGANESVDKTIEESDNILTLIPSLQNGDVGEAISGHVTNGVFSARSDATIFRRFLKEYPNIIVNMNLAPEVVDIFKAITTLLTWRSTNTSILQLIWTALQQITSYVKVQVRVLWIRNLKDVPFAPYMITKQRNGDKVCKIVQADIRTQQGSNRGIGFFRNKRN